MTVTNPISPTGASSVPIGSASTSSASQESGMASLLQPDTFLNLLVDELKYQNPLDPTNSSTFMSQIAELSQVEQLENVSSSSQISEAADLIGQTVTADDTDGTTITGTVTGVTNGTSGPTLDVEGDSVALSDVQQIGSASG
jgi:flagellar basal-body rod modification protein FlgD